MNRKNAITFDELVSAKQDTLENMSVDEIILLRDDLDARAALLDRDRKLYGLLVDTRFAGMAESAYKIENKDTGRVRVSIDRRFDLVGDRKKIVSWDQTGLGGLYSRIAQSGDNAEVYIQRTETVSYKVGEAAFKTWPENIQAAFMPFRTVKTSATQISIEPKKKEAAG